MNNRKTNYVVVARFGSEVLEAKKNDYEDMRKLVDMVHEFGGNIIEIIEEG